MNTPNDNNTPNELPRRDWALAMRWAQAWVLLAIGAGLLAWGLWRHGPNSRLLGAVLMLYGVAIGAVTWFKARAARAARRNGAGT